MAMYDKIKYFGHEGMTEEFCGAVESKSGFEKGCELYSNCAFKPSTLSTRPKDVGSS